jgi:uncharacterized protein
MADENPSDENLRRIFDVAKVIAVVGASGNPDKASNRVPAYLQQHGYRIIPVNPGGEEILGEDAVTTLDAISEDIDVVQVFRPADETPGIAEQAVAAGAKVLWLQQGITSADASEIAREAGLTVVMDDCMMEAHRRTVAASG